MKSSIPDADEIRLRHMLDAGREAVRSAQARHRSDLEQVWNAVTEDLPPLLADLQSILEPGQ